MIAGALERITAMTAQYAMDRVQFGRPIGRFQAVQHSLAMLAAQTAAAGAAADIAAEALDGGVHLPAIAAAKARAGEAAGIGAGLAHQIHGAIGFTYEHSLHFFTKRLHAWRDEYGGEAEWSERLGRHLAAQGADALWPTLTAI
jgi:alkylation response protein AidB-like acyl-CoA dehydrogenase